MKYDHDQIVTILVIAGANRGADTSHRTQLFCTTHPCFFDYEWVSDEKGRKLYKPISDYLNEKVEELNFWGKTLYYHRPLSTYFNALEHNGFSVVSLREPVPSDELLEKHPDWEYHRRIPSFIVAKAILGSKKSD